MPEEQHPVRRRRQQDEKPAAGILPDRPQPHAESIERAVLAALIRDASGCLDTARSFFKDRVSVFYKPSHREIYNTILELGIADARQVDLLSVAQRLREKNKLEAVGGEIYLAELGKITNVSIDILRRDLDTSSTPTPQTQTTEKMPLGPELDANIKAVKFVLASMLHKKDYADFWGNLEEYIINPSLKKLYKLLREKHTCGEELKISTLYDVFDVESDKVIQDVINFQFSNISSPKEYFLSCAWQMIENELKFRKATLSKQYKEEIANSKKVELLLKINEIDKQLKKKNLGDFI